MGKTRIRRKKQLQSRKRNRYKLEERHRLGISSTARAAAKKQEKNSK